MSSIINITCKDKIALDISMITAIADIRTGFAGLCGAMFSIGLVAVGVRGGALITHGLYRGMQKNVIREIILIQ